MSESTPEKSVVKPGAPSTKVTGTTVPASTTDVKSDVTPTGDEFSSKGKTRLATPSGNVFQPNGEGLPVVTPEGVNVSAEQAETILKQSDSVDGRVFKVNQEGE